MLRENKRILSLLLCIVLLLTLAPQFQLPASALNQFRAGSTPDIPATADIPIIRPPETPETVAQGVCGDNITWTLGSTGVLTLSGTGAMDDYASAANAPWYRHRNSIKTVQIGDGITSIGDRAFYGCTQLFDLVIGADVTTVGTYAFRGCTGLPAVTLPESVAQLKGSAFRGCTDLTFVQIEGNAPVLGTYVFSDGATSRTLQYHEGSTGFDVSPWTEFTHSTMHAGTWVTTVAPTCTTPGSRYIDCTYCQATFTEVLPAEHQYVDGICTVCWETMIRASGRCGEDAWWKLDVFGTLSISGSGYMWSSPWEQYCQSITTVIIHSGITNIDSYAFEDCTNLTSVTISEGVTNIYYGAFSGCTSLTSITIPESMTYIGYQAFDGCTSLENVYITELSAWCQIGFSDYASTPMYYAENLYLNDTLLTAVTIPDDVTQIGNYAFHNCTSLTSVTIPESVTSIGNCAFYNCSSLTSITIPESVTSIGHDAFYNCSSLTSITIPESVTGIGHDAFYNCSSLTSITIPESVTSIGHDAFSNCTSLTGITIPESVTSIENGAFSNCTSLTGITIPESVTSIGDSAFRSCTSLKTITFLGSAPMMDEYCFSGVQATAYHACTDTTWTDEVKKSLYGNIIWVGHLFDDYVYNQDATCTQDGTRTGYCPACDAEETVSAPNTATGHSFGSDGLCTICGNGPELIIKMSDTCSDGWNGACIEVYADGALVTTATVVSGASEEARIPYDPMKTYTFQWFGGGCPSECYFEIIGDDGLLFRSAGDSLINDRVFYTLEVACVHQYETVTVLPTCTEDGSETNSCVLCGKQTQIVLPATGHSNTVEKLEATCTANGFITTTCTVCHETSTQIDYATGHDYDGIMVKPTCTTDGSVTLTCKNCGDTQKGITPATGHHFENGICTGCGDTVDVTLTGSITTFGEGPVRMELTPVGNAEPAIPLSVSGDSYSLTAKPGNYLLSVSEDNHVTRVYTVLLEGQTVTLDVKLHLIGDVDGNGKINVGDVARVNAHIRGNGLIGDEYQLLCANINGGSLNMGDTAMLYAHIKGTKLLF